MNAQTIFEQFNNFERTLRENLDSSDSGKLNHAMNHLSAVEEIKDSVALKDLGITYPEAMAIFCKTAEQGCGFQFTQESILNSVMVISSVAWGMIQFKRIEYKWEGSLEILANYLINESINLECDHDCVKCKEIDRKTPVHKYLEDAERDFIKLTKETGQATAKIAIVFDVLSILAVSMQMFIKIYHGGNNVY